MLLVIGVVVVCLVLAAIVLPGKSGSTAAPKTASPLELLTGGPQLTLRQQQANESATAIADEFKRLDQELWLREQIAKASKLFGTSPATEPAEGDE
jgi:hypothetical protein